MNSAVTSIRLPWILNMRRLELQLRNPDLGSRLSLFWNVRPTSVGMRYFEAIQKTSPSTPIWQPDRFYLMGAPDNLRRKLTSDLMMYINQINEYKPGTFLTQPREIMSQKDTNDLHTHFEHLRGAFDSPSEFYRNAPFEIQQALQMVNILIHKYEDNALCSDAIRSRFCSKIIVNFCSDNGRNPRLPLQDEDYDHFTFKTDFGTWITDYCDVGKPLHGVWQDNDQAIGAEAIRPLRFLRADAMILFGSPVTQEASDRKIRLFYDWWSAHPERFESLGYTKFDKKNAIGNLPVADFDRDHPSVRGMNNSEILSLIGDHQYVDAIIPHQEVQ